MAQDGKRRRWKRIVLVGVLAVAVLIALAPKIAGLFAPGITEGAVSKNIAGSVEIGSVSLGWFGGQKARNIVLRDPGGSEVARLDASVGSGLVGLILGSKDLGTVKLSGRAVVVADEDGQTNLQRAIAATGTPAQPGGEEQNKTEPGEPAAWPDGLRLRLELDGVDVVYTDPKIAESTGGALHGYALTDISGASSVIGAGEPVTMRITAETGRLISAGVTDPTKDDGAVTLDIDLRDLIGADGVIDPASATGSVAFDARTPYASADAELGLGDGRVSLSEPASFTVNGESLAGVLPALRQAFDDERIKAERVPSATITVSKFSAPLSGSPEHIARAASLVANAEVESFAGVVTADGTRRSFRVSPVSVGINAEKPTERITITGDTIAELDGRSAGAITADLALVDLFAEGVPGVDAVLASASGRIALTDVATAVLEPIAAPLGIDLDRTVGPKLGAVIDAKPERDGARVSLDIRSEHVAASGLLFASPDSVRLLDGPLTLRIDDPSGLAAPFLGEEAPFQLHTSGPLALSIDRLDADIGALRSGAADAIDAKGSAAVSGANLEIVGDGGRSPFSIRSLDLAFETLGAVSGIEELPSVGVRGTIDAERCDASFALEFADSELRLTDGTSRAQIRNAGDLVAAFAPAALPVAISGNGSLGLELRALRVPIRPDRKPDLGAAIIDATGVVRGFSASYNGAEPVNLRDVALTIVQEENKATRTDLGAELGYRGERFSAEGSVALGGLRAQLSDGSFDANTINPAGRLDFRGLPPSLVELAQLDDIEGMTVAELTAGLTGGPIDATLRLPAHEGAGRRGLATVRSPGFTADLAGVLTSNTLAIEQLASAISLSPAFAEQLRSAFAPDLDTAFTDTISVSASLAPIELPLTESFRLDPARVGDRIATLTLDADASLSRLVLPAEEDAEPNDLGPLALDAGKLIVTAPLAAVAGASREELRAELTGALRGEGEQSLATLGVTARTPYRRGAQPGFVDVNASARDIDFSWIEQNFAEPGAITGPAGPSGAVNVVFRHQPNRERGAPVLLTAALFARDLKATDRLKLNVFEDRVEVIEQATLDWTLRPDYLADLMTGEDGTPPRLRLAGPVQAQVRLPKLIASRGEGPFKRGVFDLHAEADLPNAEVVFDDGTRTVFNDLSIRLGLNPNKEDQINLDASMLEMPPDDAPRAISVKGALKRFRTPEGAFDSDAVRVDLNADIPAFPTAFIDALANQNGLLLDLLGPVTSANLRARGLGKGEGIIDLNAGSDRARVDLRGDLAAGVFELTPESRAEIAVVTEQLGVRLARGIPLASSFTRPIGDRPGTITTTGMRIPTDGDVAKLAGEVTIDPGVLRFKTSRVFGTVLEAINGRTEGFIGRNLKPLTLRAENGVVRYERYRLPLGEFTIATEGAVDLVNKQIDVVTWIPLGALSDEAAGQLNTGLGRALGGIIPQVEELTMVPFRARGPTNAPNVKVDMELFTKSLGEQLRPDRVIEQGLNDLLGDLIGKPKPKKENP